MRCYACGAAFVPAGERRGAGPPRILLGRDAMLSVRERVAPAGPLTSVVRYCLGGPSAFILLLWAYVLLFFGFYFFLSGLWVLAYTLPFIVYPLLSFYCCVRLMPSRKVALLGLFAHLYALVSSLFAYSLLGDKVGTGDDTAFGRALALSFTAAWVALYAGRLMDEGRLRVGRAAQATLGVVLVASIVLALSLSHASDRRARERRLERWTYERR